jgi:cytochrome b
MKHVNVWDLATRIFHWSLVLLFIAAWVTIENRMMEAHEYIGHTLLALLLFRVIWGVIGSTTARFSHFITNPLKALGYLKLSLSLRSPHSTGHNPAGGWMVVIMLLFIGFQVLSGMYANDDLGFSGALSDSVSKSMSDTFTQLHALNFQLLIALVWIHLVAVFFYVLVKNEHLIKAMFSGKKPSTQINPTDQLSFAPLYKAAFCFALSLIAGYWLII